MSQPLDDYLSRVARELRALPVNARENELREVRSHLEQLIDDGLARGERRDAATSNALTTFGGARAVGVSMRDVWEGQEIGWKPVFAAFFVGLLFWIVAMASLVIGLMVFESWPQSALFPRELSLVFSAMALLTPTLTGAIHGLYLGRRAWILSVVVYLPYSILELTHRMPSSDVTFGGYSLSFWTWSLIWGVIGAHLTDSWLRRRRYAALSLAGIGSSASPSTLAAPRTSRRIGSWKWLWVLVVPLFLVIDVKHRLNLAQHPPRATDAVLTKLLLSRDASKMAMPDPIRVEELAPTAAELNNGTRRVRFSARCHMTKGYQERRRAWLQAQLATISNRKKYEGDYPETALRASLRRIKANDFSISGEVRVKNTVSGWQVEEDYNYWSRLRGWAEDIYYVE